MSKHEPSAARKVNWAERTGTPFDPLVSASATALRTIRCPRCLFDFPVCELADVKLQLLQLTADDNQIL